MTTRTERKTMSLYLVQHGKSLPKSQDPQEGLSPAGREETEQMARWANQAGLGLDLIQHSVKPRAKQTAEIFAKALNPKNGIREIQGIKPMDDAAVFARTIEPSENVMVVGHLPFMERLVAQIITGSTETPVAKFQNSGVLCLDWYHGYPAWMIKWSVIPQIPL